METRTRKFRETNCKSLLVRASLLVFLTGDFSSDKMRLPQAGKLACGRQA
jgi:hypothetical protein